MIGKATRLLGIAVAVLCCLQCSPAQVTSVEDEELAVSADLVEASLQEALKAVFGQTPYRYEFEYPGMAEEMTEFGFEPITLKLIGAPFSMALEAILDSHNLTYRRDRDLFRILWREWEPPPGAIHAPSPDKFQMLYLTRYGGREQLRMRILPYPGAERVLWESPDEPGRAWYLPSPSFTRAAVVWGQYYSQVFLVDIQSRRVREIAKGIGVRYLRWEDEKTLRLLDSGGKEWTYDVTGKRAVLAGGRTAGDHANQEPFLESAFAREIATFRGVIEGRKLLVPFDEREVIGAIARGAGIPHRPAAEYLVFPVAAVSPDGEHLALTTDYSKYAVFVIDLTSNHVARVIPLTELVSDENAWVEDLRWCGDSQHLTFTEVHYHPAQFYAVDVGPRPDPLDWAYVVRLYSLKGDRVRTAAVGRNAFLIPPSAQKPWYERSR